MNIGVLFSVESYIDKEMPLANFSEVPFGVSMIGTVLKNAGHQVHLHVLTPDSDLDAELSSFSCRFKPEMICMTAVTTQMLVMKTAAKTFKRLLPNIYIVLGGSHCTLNPEDAAKELSIDAFCVGEGEEAVVELAGMLDKGLPPIGIRNLWIRKPGSAQIEKNDRNPFYQELDKLPFLDREMWHQWIKNPNEMHSILLGRGCPFKCTYCSNHVLAKTSPGKYVRFRSVNNVIEELHCLIKNYPLLETVYFEVETFGANVNYAFELCAALEKFNLGVKRPLKFGINLAVTRKIARNIELLDAMKRANFSFVNIGLESGSTRVREEILTRPDYTNEDLVAFSKAARKHGINVSLFILLGLPGETVADYKQTINCARQCEPNHTMISIFYPYPGTRLYEISDEMGLLRNARLHNIAERKRALLDLPGFPRYRIQIEFIFSRFKIYKGRMSFTRRLGLLLRDFISVYPWLDHLARSFIYNTKTGRLIRRLIATRNFS